MGYVFRECLLAPYNFGIPNDRLRYFLMARLRSSFDISMSATSAVQDNTDPKPEKFDPETEIIYTSWPLPAFVEDPWKNFQQHTFNIPELQVFMDENEKDGKDYHLSRQLILERPNFRFGKFLLTTDRKVAAKGAQGTDVLTLNLSH